MEIGENRTSTGNYSEIPKKRFWHRQRTRIQPNASWRKSVIDVFTRRNVYGKTWSIFIVNAERVLNIGQSFANLFLQLFLCSVPWRCTRNYVRPFDSTGQPRELSSVLVERISCVLFLGKSHHRRGKYTHTHIHTTANHICQRLNDSANNFHLIAIDLSVESLRFCSFNTYELVNWRRAAQINSKHIRF